MCILFIAVEQHHEYPLIIAANRDEFHARPTLPSFRWDESDGGILAGKDLQAGGTWMGVNDNGYISALTNIRDPKRQMTDAISRGHLVTDYLKKMPAPSEQMENLQSSSEKYNGYNLLYGHWQELFVYNNYKNSVEKLTPGIYGLSNDDLNSEWPKIHTGVAALTEYCQSQKPLDTQHLFELLSNSEKAEDHLLPDTGVPEEWEKLLSSIFISSDAYGTRASTLLLIDKNGHLQWHERSFNQSGNCIDQKNYEISL